MLFTFDIRNSAPISFHKKIFKIPSKFYMKKKQLKLNRTKRNSLYLTQRENQRRLRVWSLWSRSKNWIVTQFSVIIQDIQSNLSQLYRLQRIDNQKYEQWLFNWDIYNRNILENSYQYVEYKQQLKLSLGKIFAFSV